MAAQTSSPAAAGTPKEISQSVPVPAKRRPPWVLIAIGVVAVAAGAWWYIMQIGREYTDDAQVDSDVVSIPSRTSALVKKINFTDNQHVKAGDVLVELDDVPGAARLAQAQAQLDAAESSAAAADADVRVVETQAKGNHSVAKASLVGAASSASSTQQQISEAEASVQTAKVTLDRVKTDLDRMKQLVASGSATQSDLDHTQSEYDIANSRLTQAEAHLRVLHATLGQATSSIEEANARIEATDVDVIVAQAKAKATVAHSQVAVAKTTRDLAALDLSYTKIYAPSDGVISKRAVSVGQMASNGQSILQMIPDEKPWITGNFKETQLAEMKLDQIVDVNVDAYPSAKIIGKVESFSGATGARFALLPPDNATGNFTKVVQRVPVRVTLVDFPKNIHLVPGLSVSLTVHTR